MRHHDVWIAASLLVDSHQDDFVGVSTLQTGDEEVRSARGDGADQLFALKSVNFHGELLRKSTVEAFRALYLQRVGCLIQHGTVQKRVRLTCDFEFESVAIGN